MSEEKRIEIYQGEKGEVCFSVEPETETIWATERQMAAVFDVDRSVINRHIRNIYKVGELTEEATCVRNAQVQKEGARMVKRMVPNYNLDMIISVGYRVNSKKATRFRQWSTRVLHKYIVDGGAVNVRRVKELPLNKLKALEEALGVAGRLVRGKALNADEASGVLEVITRYGRSFETLEEFDRRHISFGKSQKAKKHLSIEKSQALIEQLRQKSGASELFGKPRGEAFSASMEAIYQTFDDDELYPSVAEKAANLLYFIIKDHPFYDGNKRIASLLFLMFLAMNDVLLTESGETKISDRALVALALLIAESKASEKDLMVALVRKLLD